MATLFRAITARLAVEIEASEVEHLFRLDLYPSPLCAELSAKLKLVAASAGAEAEGNVVCGSTGGTKRKVSLPEFH